MASKLQTPMRVAGNGVVVDCNGHRMHFPSDCDKHEIVRRVNSHDDLEADAKRWRYVRDHMVSAEWRYGGGHKCSSKQTFSGVLCGGTPQKAVDNAIAKQEETNDGE